MSSASVQPKKAIYIKLEDSDSDTPLVSRRPPIDRRKEPVHVKPDNSDSDAPLILSYLRNRAEPVDSDSDTPLIQSYLRHRIEPVANIERPETIARREYLRSLEEKRSREENCTKKSKPSDGNEDGDYCPSADDNIAPRTPTPPLASRRRVKRQHWPRQHPGTPPPTPRRKRQSKSTSAFSTPDHKTFEISLTPVSPSPISDARQYTTPTMKVNALQRFPGWSPSAEQINKTSQTHPTPVSPSPSRKNSHNMSASMANTRLLFPESSPSAHRTCNKRRIEEVHDEDFWEVPPSPRRKKTNVTTVGGNKKDEWTPMW